VPRTEHGRSKKKKIQNQSAAGAVIWQLCNILFFVYTRQFLNCMKTLLPTDPSFKSRHSAVAVDVAIAGRCCRRCVSRQCS
jgi:hypothetical protein